MISICPKCGSTEWNKEITPDGNHIKCMDCGNEWGFKRLPLFIITGASGVGKTTTLQKMMLSETRYICMDSDIVFFMQHKTPDQLRFKREVVMVMAKNISQIGMPVVMCAASLPEQFEDTYNRRFFSKIYYLALVCEPSALRKRMCEGRHIDDESWIKGSVDFNNWFIVNGEKQTPKIDICDISNRTVDEVAVEIDKWVTGKMDDECIVF